MAVRAGLTPAAAIAVCVRQYGEKGVFRQVFKHFMTAGVKVL
jgi:hypothetical protein